MRHDIRDCLFIQLSKRSMGSVQIDAISCITRATYRRM